MKKLRLLIRSDDLGYSEAVNYGIEKVLRFGLTRSVGLMPNMPSAEHGIMLLKGLESVLASTPTSVLERR